MTFGTKIISQEGISYFIPQYHMGCNCLSLPEIPLHFSSIFSAEIRTSPGGHNLPWWHVTHVRTYHLRGTVPTSSDLWHEEAIPVKPRGVQEDRLPPNRHACLRHRLLDLDLYPTGRCLHLRRTPEHRHVLGWLRARGTPGVCSLWTVGLLLCVYEFIDKSDHLSLQEPGIPQSI